MSGSKEQGDLFWTLTHQETQSGIFDKFFLFVVVKWFTADCNLLQPTGCVYRTPSHVTFLALACIHFHVVRDIGSRCFAHVIHVSSARCCCLDTLRPATLCSPTSLIFLFILLFFIFIFHVGWFDVTAGLWRFIRRTPSPFKPPSLPFAPPPSNPSPFKPPLPFTFTFNFLPSSLTGRGVSWGVSRGSLRGVSGGPQEFANVTLSDRSWHFKTGPICRHHHVDGHC